MRTIERNDESELPTPASWDNVIETDVVVVVCAVVCIYIYIYIYIFEIKTQKIFTFLLYTVFHVFHNCGNFGNI